MVVVGREAFICCAMADHKSIALSRYFYKYHVIVHESAFDSFLYILDENIVPYWYNEHGDHVHFLVYSKYPFKIQNGIKTSRIENKSRLRYVIRNYFEPSVERLQFYYSIKFENPSLEEIAMDKINFAADCTYYKKSDKLFNVEILFDCPVEG